MRESSAPALVRWKGEREQNVSMIGAMVVASSYETANALF